MTVEVFVVLYAIAWFVFAGYCWRKCRSGRVTATPIMVLVRFGSSGLFASLRGSRALKLLLSLMVLAFGYGVFEFYRITVVLVVQRVFGGGAPAAFTPILPGITISIETFLYLLPGITLAVVVHELAHAVAARAEGVELKSFGVLSLLAFIYGAFVELDEDSLKRASLWSRVKIYAAGPAVNILLGLALISLIGWLSVQGTAVVLTGVQPGSPAEEAGLRPGYEVVGINGTRIESVEGLVSVLSNSTAAVFIVRDEHGLREIFVSKNGSEKYGIVIAAAPRALIDLLGVELGLGAYTVLYMAMSINIALGVINAAPLFITDGAKVVYDVLGERRRLIATIIQVVSLGLLAANLNLGFIG